MPDGSVLPGRPGVSRTWGTAGRERAGGARERLLIRGDPFSSQLAAGESSHPLFFLSSFSFFFPQRLTLSAVSYSLPPPKSLCIQQHLSILCSTTRFPFQSHAVLHAVTYSQRKVAFFPRPGCRLAALGPVSGAGINLCINLASCCFCNLLILFARQVQSLC